VNYLKFRSVDELITYTKGIVGKRFGELDKYNLLEKKGDKGVLGKIVETGFYGYPLNNDAKADFDNLCIELKVAGFKEKRDKTLVAKERLVLSKIDYMEIIHESYEFSKLLFKNKRLLIIWYQYYEGKNYPMFQIHGCQLYDMTKDEIIFKNDFNIIKDKVKRGEAHLLSEGDTSYLGACTKGAKGTDRTKQPNSDKEAKPRAYALKSAYMTGILKSLYIDSDGDFGQYRTVEEYIKNILKPFYGLTQREIYSSICGITIAGSVPKNIGKMISDRLIGKDRDLEYKHDLFRKTTYKIKNIPVDKDYYPLERLSFRNLVLSEFLTEWEDSDWKTYFEEVTLILICYEGGGTKNGDRVLKSVKKITFTADDIERFGKSYRMVREAIIKEDISKLPYPKKFKEPTLVIAPKGNAGDDAYENFFKHDTTKSCFMLDEEYIYNKIAQISRAE
jgi:DNA mismatch repair protein MutH